jgi:DNA adenine methylase
LTLSPLRYPGGKSRAVHVLYEVFPKDVKAICSPFFGGGSFEIFLSRKGVRIYGYDSFRPLVEFWEEAIGNPEVIAEEAARYFPLTTKAFYRLQREQSELPTKRERAAAFFVLNRSSFSGSTLSGGMSPGHPRFNNRAIERLRRFTVSNISVKQADFTESIQRHASDFLFLDPPYLINRGLYGVNGDAHKRFKHEDLRELLGQRTGWLLCYNDCDEVRRLYAGYRFLAPTWNYGMNKTRKSRELLIVNI